MENRQPAQRMDPPASANNRPSLTGRGLIAGFRNMEARKVLQTEQWMDIRHSELITALTDFFW